MFSIHLNSRPGGRAAARRIGCDEHRRRRSSSTPSTGSCARSAGCSTAPARGKLLVSGPEAAEYLQGQLTNDVEALEPGEGQYAALLDRKGHMQADMRVLRLAAEEIWIDTEPEALAAARRHLEMYKIGREVEVDDVSEERAILSLIGPARRRDRRHRRAAGARQRSDRRRAASSAWPRARADGIDLIVAVRRGRAAARRPARQPAPSRSTPRPPRSSASRPARPRFGAEMGTATMPAEAGIVEDAVSFTKGCYIGQETVARLHYKGKPNRHLRGLRLSAPAERRRRPCASARRRSASSAAAASPPPTGRSRWRSSAARPSPAAELAVGEDGVTARVVDLPFG